VGFEQQVGKIIKAVKDAHVDDHDTLRGPSRCKACGEKFPCDASAMVELTEALLTRCTSYCVAVDHASAQLSHMSALLQAANIRSQREHGTCPPREDPVLD
jgi:hypothetical protein